MSRSIFLFVSLLMMGCGDGVESHPSADAGTAPAELRCSSPAECSVPSGCWFAGCMNKVCTFEPAGCETP